jgi:L-rhamnose isomerase
MGKQSSHIGQAYQLAKDRYAALGVDTDKALQQLSRILISYHCWLESGCGSSNLPA